MASDLRKENATVAKCGSDSYRQRQSADETGSAVLEFAFALMLLLPLTFGMIDLGSALYAANVIQSAAQMGARAGIVDPATATTTVYDQLAGLNPANAQVNVVLVDGERITVEVTYQYELLTPLATQLIGDGLIVLTGEASMLIY